MGSDRRLENPLPLTIANGVVVSIEGDDRDRQNLEGKFAENLNCRNMAELGIGTNDKASRPDNVLEAEKILGTIHMALGDNCRLRRQGQRPVPRGLRLLPAHPDGDQATGANR